MEAQLGPMRGTRGVRPDGEHQSHTSNQNVIDERNNEGRKWGRDKEMVRKPTDSGHAGQVTSPSHQ